MTRGLGRWARGSMSRRGRPRRRTLQTIPSSARNAHAQPASRTRPLDGHARELLRHHLTRHARRAEHDHVQRPRRHPRKDVRMQRRVGFRFQGRRSQWPGLKPLFCSALLQVGSAVRNRARAPHPADPTTSARGPYGCARDELTSTMNDSVGEGVSRLLEDLGDGLRGRASDAPSWLDPGSSAAADAPAQGHPHWLPISNRRYAEVVFKWLAVAGSAQEGAVPRKRAP